MMTGIVKIMSNDTILPYLLLVIEVIILIIGITDFISIVLNGDIGFVLVDIEIKLLFLNLFISVIEITDLVMIVI